MMHNFNHYMDKISLLDGKRCILAPDEWDLDVNHDGPPKTDGFGSDNFPEFDREVLGKGLKYVYTDQTEEDYYKNKNDDLLIDCVPNLFEIGKVWGEVFSGLTGSSLTEALIVD
jgi:hypothetical protein